MAMFIVVSRLPIIRPALALILTVRNFRFCARIERVFQSREIHGDDALPAVKVLAQALCQLVARVALAQDARLRSVWN